MKALFWQQAGPRRSLATKPSDGSIWANTSGCRCQHVQHGPGDAFFVAVDLRFMKPSLQLRLSQHLALTPQLQQSIRLLQLSTLELNQELDQALADNPLLERDDDPQALAMRVKPDGSIAVDVPLPEATGDAVNG